MFWYTRYKNRKEAERFAAKERSKVAKESANRKAIEAIEIMLQQPCPFLNMNNCSEYCAHFKEGGAVFEFSPSPHFPGRWVTEYPRCKLWRD